MIKYYKIRICFVAYARMLNRYYTILVVYLVRRRNFPRNRRENVWGGTRVLSSTWEESEKVNKREGRKEGRR